MFFVLEFFLAIVSYQLLKSDWIVIITFLFFRRKFDRQSKDLGSNPSAVENVFFSTDRCSKFFTILSIILYYSLQLYCFQFQM